MKDAETNAPATTGTGSTGTSGAEAGTSTLIQTFMTHGMDDATVRTLATGREEETARILDAVERSLKAVPGSLQHVVVYGPRGMGKSFVARLVQIRSQELAESRGLTLPYVLLPEEQHNLTRSPHALPAYIAQRLADWRSGEDRSWREAMFQWPEPEQEAQLWDTATAALEQELDSSLAGDDSAASGMAIVVIENFDLMLATVFKDERAEQRLRKWLDRQDNRLMLIATATGSVDMDYDRPLFQAFQPIRLSPWSGDDCIAYFNRRRTTEDKAALDPTEEAKARAIADFIGGNPRLAQLLSEVLETQDALSVAGTMTALSDKLADYYRRRIEDLAPLAQGLLDALIRGGEPASQTLLAERVGARSQSTIARVMQELQGGDIIRGIPARESRETLYRVTDRVFVHYYRLRQGNQQAQQTPLATILDFLRAFYSRDEQRSQAAGHLDAGRPAEARLFADLALEGETTALLRNSYVASFPARLKWLAGLDPNALTDAPDALLRQLQQHPERLACDTVDSPAAAPIIQAIRDIVAAWALTRMVLPEKAEACLRTEIEKARDPAAEVLLRHELSLFLGHVRHDQAANRQQLVAICDLNLSDLPSALRVLALRGRARLQQLDGQYEEALATGHEAAGLAAEVGDWGQQALSLRYAAISLGRLNRHEEAVAIAREAAGLAAEVGDRVGQALLLRHAAFSLGRLDLHEQAVATAREAAGLSAEAGDLFQQAVSMGYAAFSLGQLDHHEEAVATASKAAGLSAEVCDRAGQALSLRHAAFSLGRLDRHEQAVASAREAAGLAAEAGDLFQQAVSLGYAAFSLGQLGQHEEAIATAREAAGLAAEVGDRGEQAESRQHAAYSLNELGRPKEALSEALAGFDLAVSAADAMRVGFTTIQALRAALHVPSSEAVSAFAVWGGLDDDLTDQGSGLDWRWWFGGAIAAAALANAWDQLDHLIDSHPDLLSGEYTNLDDLGSVIAQVGASDGRAAGFETARQASRRLAKLWSTPKEDHSRSPLTRLVSGFARDCHDPGLLRDVAGLLTPELSPHAPEQATLLRALADLDAADDPQALLARQDPDLALWLGKIRDLPQPEPKPRRRKGRGAK